MDRDAAWGEVWGAGKAGVKAWGKVAAEAWGEVAEEVAGAWVEVVEEVGAEARAKVLALAWTMARQWWP